MATHPKRETYPDTLLYISAQNVSNCTSAERAPNGSKGNPAGCQAQCNRGYPEQVSWALNQHLQPVLAVSLVLQSEHNTLGLTTHQIRQRMQQERLSSASSNIPPTPPPSNHRPEHGKCSKIRLIHIHNNLMHVFCRIKSCGTKTLPRANPCP